ncbi:MAG: hypothetical protein JWR15_3462 [Prosthecobacter sp.]|nr:hypothetical protein [Prosthecobacter sp.]
MQCLGAFRQFGEIAVLQRFGERVEQAQHIWSCKGIMTWLTPLMQHGWDKTAAHAYRGAMESEDFPFGRI